MNRKVWAQSLHLAARRFGLLPAEFWKLSVWEWQSLLSSLPAEHVDRGGLDQLILQYPDKQ
jgi:hypothetical protein